VPDFIGIHADILAEVGDAIKPEELCEALRCYTHNRCLTRTVSQCR